MKLITPSTKFEKSYMEALDEGKNETGITRLTPPKSNQSFSEFVTMLTSYKDGKQLPTGWVPSTELWLIDKDTFIGRVSIRHTLTPTLLKVGGHIGYWIRPSKRKQGYGKHILKLALPVAKNLGIPRVLVTCDSDNIPSQKIIEKNGGILEDTITDEFGEKRRYWIQL